MWPYRDFTQDEMRCKCGCSDERMNADFMWLLQALRTVTGIPMRVTSGYRCPSHDAAVGGSTNPGAGPHTTGRAIDIALSGSEARTVVGAAIFMGFTGVFLLQKGHDSGRFLHLDNLSSDYGRRPTIGTWNRSR